jgi:hypothetical protein
MANHRISDRKSVHRLAFSHYLRTGERFTNDEWVARYERKFNPYHDELGRFTSPPGVTVSYGNSGRGSRRDSSGDPGVAPPLKSPSRQRQAESIRTSSGSTETAARGVARIENRREPFRSDTVQAAAIVQRGPADTDFELRIRQASLDAFRRSLGSKATPEELADMADIQKRLDHDRARLDDIRRRILDPETVELLRALPPADTLAASINVARGEGDLRDAISLISSIPIAGPLGKLAKVALAERAAGKLAGSAEIIQLGGAYRDIRGLPGYEAHHSLGKAVSPLSVGDGPSIAMLKADHRALVTSGSHAEGAAFRKLQAEHIAKGDYAEAIQMDIDHIRLLFGNKYDESISQMLSQARRQGLIK